MKKSVLVSIIIAVTAQCAFAADLLSTEPAPAQSFHTVQSNAVQSNPSSVTPAPQPAATTPQPAATTPQPAATVSAPAVSSAALESGAAIISSGISQSAASGNENDATRIQNLMATNQAMVSAIRAINQNVTILQQQMMELESAHPTQASNGLMQMIQNPDFISFASFGGVVVFLLSLGVIIGRKVVRKAESVAVLSQKRVHVDVLDDDTKTEYDFMSSDEAIPAKLDLARAYIAMNDEEQARMVLTTVIEKGNQEQRSEALSLIQAMLNKK